MDFTRAIRELKDEKRKLDRAIVMVESLLAGESAEGGKRRGRKSMPEEERQIVSERMKRYWASRRNHAAAAKADS